MERCNAKRLMENTEQFDKCETHMCLILDEPGRLKINIDVHGLHIGVGIAGAGKRESKRKGVQLKISTRLKQFLDDTYSITVLLCMES